MLYIMPSRTTKRSIMTVFTVQTDRSNDLMKTPRCHLINENSDRTISLDFLEKKNPRTLLKEK